MTRNESNGTESYMCNLRCFPDTRARARAHTHTHTHTHTHAQCTAMIDAVHGNTIYITASHRSTNRSPLTCSAALASRLRHVRDDVRSQRFEHCTMWWSRSRQWIIRSHTRAQALRHSDFTDNNSLISYSREMSTLRYVLVDRHPWPQLDHPQDVYEFLIICTIHRERERERERVRENVWDYTVPLVHNSCYRRITTILSAHTQVFRSLRNRCFFSDVRWFWF
jgi:hypothetical protein